MVGIVVVSHSATLAEGVRELADQMVQGKVPLATAGGIDDPEQPIGTDPMKVMAAVESVYSEDGVLVLMDLGSALLSAEMALEFLPEEQQANVKLCAAPLVEGTMAAAVQSMVGGSLAQVLAEAEGALAVKAEQLNLAPPAEANAAGSSASTEESAAESREVSLEIRNKMGLHARPAANFVQVANKFQAEISVRKGEKTANAKSINQVATLGARQGETIVVTAVGSDSAEAIEAIQALAADNFGERETEAAPVGAATAVPTEAKEGQLQGIAASPGIAIGPVLQYRPKLPAIERQTGKNGEAEWQRLQTAVNTAVSELQTLQTQTAKQVGAEEAAIFEAHQLILQDPDLETAVRQTLDTEQINAEAAWHEAIEAAAAQFAAMDDPYFQARAADVRDVGNRVLRHLLGVSMPSLEAERPYILVAADLTPSDTAQLDPALVLAICTELGGATAHSAILARALGIPAVVGAGHALAEVAEGQMVGVDGRTGQIWLTPDDTQIGELQAMRDEWQAAQQAAKAASQAIAHTADDVRIEVAANIGGPHDVDVALGYGAEGVGLFRTEFLFLDRQEAPSEAEQLAAYRQVVAGLGDRPLIIRTLDVGGDKPLPYLDLGEEENPFLGWRGIRFCLDMPEIFLPQLRAILQASVREDGTHANVKLMFPMIGTLAELRRAKAMLQTAREQLQAEGKPFADDLAVGIMIELPSAVAVADLLAAEVDFFSIGTNDLTQYVMAADRGNANVAELAQAFQPAVLRMIRQTAAAAKAAGIWVGMCGELAGNPLATPLLLGLGLTELSMAAPSIPAVKAALRNWTVPEAEALAEEVLGLDSVTAVQSHLEAAQK
ncbi:MAG: phosphoenolpyruvate--protein phosphotransferase [Ardenticatenaceae bacterium]|nr:phosphoenolpyruvate--protein phosphotransferase [Ardenticatenaceae bacterium]MCB8948693.1 phosphoenolpyruvate--protein phosphotransferase [Ardenticatenaceae bacterium]